MVKIVARVAKVAGAGDVAAAVAVVVVAVGARVPVARRGRKVGLPAMADVMQAGRRLCIVVQGAMLGRHANR